MSIYLVTTYGIKKNPKQEKTSINTRDRWGEVASGRQELQTRFPAMSKWGGMTRVKLKDFLICSWSW
jgi:hypothetical protein